jgi:37-kD nucleoid-associated bacterial protein
MDSYPCLACDSQRPFGSTDELAQFWLRFLGCKVAEEPRVATKKFFEAALDYANTAMTDPVEKTTFYDHVVSELTSEKKSFSPKAFIEGYVPKAYREGFASFLEERQVSLKQFPLDTAEIASRLRRRSYHTSKGIEVRVPEEESNVVQIGEHDIVISDTVTRVDHK